MSADALRDKAEIRQRNLQMLKRAVAEQKAALLEGKKIDLAQLGFKPKRPLLRRKLV